MPFNSRTKLRRATGSPYLSPGGGGGGHFSRGQTSVVRQLSTPNSSAAERIRVYIVLSEPLGQLLLHHHILTEGNHCFPQPVTSYQTGLKACPNKRACP
ncbi:jg22094 [Pararge aegeria aegeria]|uniref:Jg22094 protein n=1 Tax=Pararge aegeria aegeria TaxID=348720 RepID=A0A8S4RLF5_9NEOP|nr:jg22094 [Pararge aegeria aegeria]